MQCLVPPGDVNQLTINAGYEQAASDDGEIMRPKEPTRWKCC
ncbi:hypothetical protein AD34_4295 [Escherichia coli 5-172-05_S4_C3]|nr:hypothetical protein AD04_4836 [Escherichia coli 5-172-05_S4_C2]KEL58515.1 hypothetical protein AD34_4295 [Escherichia coli 5-172-05_S4_C3]